MSLPSPGARTCMALLLFGLVGCADGPSDARRDPASSSRWMACPPYTQFEGVPAECTFVPVPLDPANPDRTIDIFVARVRGSAPEAEKRGQVWFLTGGPGASVIGFVKQSQFFAELRPEWDFYSFEQRGVGNSAALLCEAAPNESGVVTVDEAPACLAEVEQAWPEGISNFTVTNTAEDLARVIDTLRIPDKEVVVYGVSYGTYLLQRYLALHGDQPDAVVLDSIAPAGATFYDQADRDLNDAARMIMEACGQDPGCSQRLAPIAPDPFASMGVILDRVDDGTLCPALQASLDEPLDRGEFRNLFGRMTEQVPLRALLPPTIYRLDRCNDGDVVALRNLIDPIFFPEAAAAGIAAPDPRYLPADEATGSSVLFDHLVLSELWGGTPLEELQRQSDQLFASLDTALLLGQVADAGIWPTYSDPRSNLHAATDRPVLMLNAELDGQTPLEDALRIRADLHGPTQYFVTMPGAGHIVLLNSVLRGASGDRPEDNCGTLVMLSFLDDPTRPPDTSCRDDVQRLDFDAADPFNRTNSLENFGTEDMWDGVPAVSP